MHLLLLLLLLLQGVSRPAAIAPVMAVRLQRRSQQPHAVGYEARAANAQPALPQLPLWGPGPQRSTSLLISAVAWPPGANLGVSATYSQSPCAHRHPVFGQNNLTESSTVRYLPYSNCR